MTEQQQIRAAAAMVIATMRDPRALDLLGYIEVYIETGEFPQGMPLRGDVARRLKMSRDSVREVPTEEQ